MADKEPTVRSAAGIQVVYCSRGQYHIELLDAGHVVFARATMTRELLAMHMGECADVIDAVSVGGVALMPARGHA